MSRKAAAKASFEKPEFTKRLEEWNLQVVILVLLIVKCSTKGFHASVKQQPWCCEWQASSFLFDQQECENLSKRQGGRIRLVSLLIILPEGMFLFFFSFIRPAGHFIWPLQHLVSAPFSNLSRSAKSAARPTGAQGIALVGLVINLPLRASGFKEGVHFIITAVSLG